MSDELPEPSSITVVEDPPGTITLTGTFVDGIGLYKLALGFGDEDEDVAAVRAALTVQLSAIVGP
jgi:hypothetical protein